MYHFTNQDNICKVSFVDEPLLVSQVPPPSLSEVISEARLTGQMPYSSQRTPVPSYTNDIDADQFFDSPDKVGDSINADRFASHIVDVESKLADDKKRLNAFKKTTASSSSQHSGDDDKQTA